MSLIQRDDVVQHLSAAASNPPVHRGNYIGGKSARLLSANAVRSRTESSGGVTCFNLSGSLLNGFSR
jgi:hypothetical protein